MTTRQDLDALPPRAMARKAEEVGCRRRDRRCDMFALAVLAGAFIAMGAIFATTVTAGGASLPFGVSRLLGGLAFSLGLILVVVAGAELFTGNNLIVMAWAGGKRLTASAASQLGDRVRRELHGRDRDGGLLFLGKQYTFGKGAVGEQALSIATSKTGSAFPGDRARRALQRPRVPRDLAHVQRADARRQGAGDRAADHGLRRRGLRAQRRQHVLHPDGALRRSDSSFAAQHAVPGVAHLTWGHFFASNLVPVTIGNVAGGALMVGAIYWFVYYEHKEEDDVDTDGNQRFRPRRARRVSSGIRG